MKIYSKSRRVIRANYTGNDNDCDYNNKHYNYDNEMTTAMMMLIWLIDWLFENYPSRAFETNDNCVLL